jgi:hypothetical protein
VGSIAKDVVNLPVPKEPIEIKKRALEKCEDPSWSLIGRYKVIRFFTLSANFLPRYLWHLWRDELKRMDIPWHLFLKVISAHDRDVERWVEGELSWNDLVQSIERALLEAKSGRL